MKRIATVSTVLAILTLGLATPAQAAPVAVWTSPSSGEAGSTIDVNVAVFTPGSTVEVHAGTFDGPLLGLGTTDSAGEGSVGITIPWGAPEGFYTLAVCETTFVACTDTWSDFWLGATTTFFVTPPAPTTTGIPEILLEPDTGEAGSTTTVSISGFTPNSTFEINLGEWCCALVGSGTTNGVGEAAVLVRIPDGIPEGELTITVCETQFVACHDTTSDFWVGLWTFFSVTVPDPPPSEPPPAPAPTDTTAAPTPPIAAPATTTTTAAPATTTTTVAEAAPVVRTATPGVGADNDVVALPILQEPVGDSGSDLWWLLLVVLGTGLIGALLAWTLQEED